MAKKFQRGVSGIFQRTFNDWKATYDPEDQWLEGNILREGSKKIGGLTCRVCCRLKETESLSCGRESCCADFVDGKCHLAHSSISKHKQCKHHLQAMRNVKNYVQVSEDDNVVPDSGPTPDQDPGEAVENAAPPETTQDPQAVQDDTQDLLSALQKSQVIQVHEDAIGVGESSQGHLQVYGGQPVTGTNVIVDNGVMWNNVHAHTVNNVVNQHRSQSQEFSLVSKTLKKAYSEMAFGVLMPWLHSDVINLADYFYKVDIVETVTGTDGKKIKPPSDSRKLEHIFGRVNGLKPTRIILHDNEAFLSSMALLQLCRSWSHLQGPATIFDVVIHIDGQQLATKSLNELIVDSCRTNKVDDNVLYNLISNNPKVLLILDGLPSELSDGQRTALNGLLWSDSFEDTTVIVCAPNSKFVTSRGTDHKGFYVTCSSDKQCTKLIRLHHLTEDEAIQFISSNLPYVLASKTQAISELRSKVQKCDFVTLQSPLFELLLMHVFLREELSKIETSTDLYMAVIKRFVMDSLMADDPNLYSFNRSSIPQEAQLLSRVGEYVLKTLAGSNSHLSVDSLKEHFQDDLIPVLKFGFVILRFQYSNKLRVEKLQSANQEVLEFMIAYHLWMVCKTQSTKRMLEEVDRLNAIRPMFEDSCTFVCECLADLLGDDVEEVYLCLRRKRSQYKYLVEILDIKVQRQKMLGMDSVALMYRFEW